MRKALLVGFALLLASSTPAWAQQYVISTIAGGAPPPTPVAALSASIGSPQDVATDAVGNVYFTSLNCVFKVDQRGVLTRLAGTSRPGYLGDGGPATNALLNGSSGVAVDSVGNVYIADYVDNLIRKVSTSGFIGTVVGTGTSGYTGDGGPAIDAQLYYPFGIAIDSGGNLYIADFGNYRIRKVTSRGIISTVAGNGVPGSSGDGGPATSAQLYALAVTVDSAGNLYIADHGDRYGGSDRVLKVSLAGIITTVAGNGLPGFSGDGGPAIAAQLSDPAGLAVDGGGNLYIADSSNGRIRKVTPSGIITTVAGNGASGYSGDGGPATDAQLNFPDGIAVDRTGNLYIADNGNNRIRKVTPGGIITTVAGNGSFRESGDGGPAAVAQLNSPDSLALDGAGNLYIADFDNNRVRKISPDGIIRTVAGNGTYGYSGDDGPATEAQLKNPEGLAGDSAGNLYFADYYNNRIRKVSPSGIITTVAGNGTGGDSGDGGPAVNAQLSAPDAVAVDGTGNLYIADASRIRKVSPAGIITTVVGGAGPAHGPGDGGPAINAYLYMPGGIVVDNAGNIYIADSYLQRIRKVTADGIINTVAGNGTLGYSGDGGPATNAQLRRPSGMALDSVGNLYFADTDNNRIRKLSPDGIITTVAGSGSAEPNQGGFSGDGGPATNAQLNSPTSIAVDSAGNVYVADAGNHAIRLLQPVRPAVTVNAVTNAASNLTGPIAPGEIVVLYGSGIGPAQLAQLQLNDSGFVGTTLAGTQVLFNGTPAPLIYSWTTQVAAIVPYEVSGTSAQVQVTYLGQTSNPVTVPIAASAPEIFTLDSTGKGQAAAINQDNSINDAGHPAPMGSVVSLYATGEGQTSPPGMDGQLAGSSLPHPILPVSVTIGGIPAQVDYAGGAPTLVAGVMQVNAHIPSGIQPGNVVPVILTVGNASSQPGITIAVAGQ